MDTQYVDQEEDVAQEAEDRDYEFGAQAGDPRRCPRHPGVRTSSNDGLHDASCDLCEAESEEAYQEWLYSPENPERVFCALPTVWSTEPWRTAATCLDVPVSDDEIPF